MKTKHRFLVFLLFAIPAVSALALFFTIPTNEQNAIILGYSKSRLTVGLVLLVVGLISIAFAIYSIKYSEKTRLWLVENLEIKKNLIVVLIISCVLFLLSFIILEYPVKYLGKLEAIHERLIPILIWILLTSLEILIGLLIWQILKKAENHIISKPKILAMLTTFGITCLIWLLIVITKLGLVSSGTFWSKIGVPLLWPQVFLALFIGLSANYLMARSKLYMNKQKTLYLELGVVLIIWTAAVLLWNGQNFVQGVFNTPPKPPSFEIFPINDSYIFDVAAQKMLIGQKMINDVVDKPIYISFLAILHYLAGPSYSFFYLLQIMSFAFIPVLGYILGKSLHSRPVGIMFAVLLLIKELNAIALTNYIHVSTSKMRLSEMLTTLGVLLFGIFFFRSAKSQTGKITYLCIAGGILGLTSLSRLNSIGIYPMAIILLGGISKFKIKPWVITAFTFSLFVVISIVPWMVRSYHTSGDPLSFVKSKTSGVIVNQRYDPIIKPGPETETHVPLIEKYSKLGQKITTNYLHNLIGITLMLPPSFELFNLYDMIRLPYWKLDWDGRLMPGGFWIILIVVILTSLGVASVWTRWRWAGLVPLAVILGYNITTAISLTSGGRYLVPIDWGILLYFSIGLYEATIWLLQQFDLSAKILIVETDKPCDSQSYKVSNILLLILVFLTLGASPILLETLPKKVYFQPVNLSDFLKANQSLPEINKFDLSNLKSNFTTSVFYGKALYARYYGENKGEEIPFRQFPLLGSANFDRLSFLLIGGSSDLVVLLPTESIISENIQGSETWVLGCKRNNYIEAVFVVFRQKGEAYSYWQNIRNQDCY